MKALLVDAGNTRVAFAAWGEADGHAVAGTDCWRAAPPLRRLGSLPTPVEGDGEAEFTAAAARLVARAQAPLVVLVSVVPRVAHLLGSLGAEVRPADHTCALPFAHRLRDPAATGADRLCNVAAAAAAGLADALVVDAGTATTVDVLKDGVFLGGVIAPGMAFAAAQIGRRAARLQPQPFGPVPLVAGPDTASALAAGGFHAGRGGVEALIVGLQAAHGPLPVVLTGGLGSHLAGPGRWLDPDWTFRGAARLALGS